MCGRYIVGEESDEMRMYLDRAAKDAGGAFEIRRGEVFPGDGCALILAGKTPGTAQVAAAHWGLMPKTGGRPLINGRAETVLTKPSFRPLFASGRCAVPATGFFEWQHDGDGKTGEKYRFFPGQGSLLFFAGLYAPDNGGRRFTILTTAANPSVSDIHPRMPVLLPRGELRAWLHDEQEAQRLLQAEMPPLLRVGA